MDSTMQTIVPSRQIRILPGIGKVHVVHSYDRLIPYIGHKRLTVVSAPPHIIRVRPSVIIREIDRITHKARPYIYYSPTSSYLNSESATIQQKLERVAKDIDDSIDESYNRRKLFFDDETRWIRAQSTALLKRIHAPVPRVRLSWPITTVRYHYELPLPVRITSDDYIHRMLTPIRTMKSDIYNISHYYNEPIRRPLGVSHLACVRYGGDKAYSRRRNLTLQEIYAMQSDTVRNDIQLLSYYIKSIKERKALEAGAPPPAKALSALRPTRVFSKPQLMLGETEEMKELREQRAERLKKIYEVEDKPVSVEDAGARIKRSTKKQEEERLAEERALAEETAKKKEQAKREEEARRAELARQEALAAQAAAERQAELDRKAELARQEELARKAEEERLARVEAEKAEQARLEEEKREAELAKQEEERQQLLRLEEIARQAEEEKEKELARQAEELAELARQEAELAEKAKQESELAELAKRETELAELEKQEKELAGLDRKERDEAELAKQEVEAVEAEQLDAELAAAEAEAKLLENNIPADEETTAEEPAAAEETASAEETVVSKAEAAATELEAAQETEPVIEEPDTPEVTTQQDKPTAEEVEDEEEEDEE